MVLLNGGQRAEADLKRLLSESGWNLARIIPTQSAMFVMEGGHA